MSLLRKFKNGSIGLPNRWGLGQAEIHYSLLVTLGLLSMLMLAIGGSSPGRYELRFAAITLPIVWVVRLAVRTAAQHLALGGFANSVQTVLGPTGNLSSDYEVLPPTRIYAYALAGQLATVALALLGLIIAGATASVPSDELSLAHVLLRREMKANAAALISNGTVGKRLSVAIKPLTHRICDAQQRLVQPLLKSRT